MGVLQKILEHKRGELSALRRRKLPPAPSPRPSELKRTVGDSLRLITEIKRRSPSAGPLSQALSVEERARCYAEHGASLISVLCDEQFFDGSYEHLSRAREVCGTPLLCKEFVIDECQLDAAAAYGADAVLLIVRCLTPGRLQQLIDAATKRRLKALVEVHAPSEVGVALDCGATFIGVNARDLDTLEMKPELAAKVLNGLPKAVIRAHLSGVRTPADVVRLRQSGVDAALIGEVLMRQDDPSPLLQSLANAADPDVLA